MKVTNKIQGVYLLHFSRPYKGARHYIGYSDDIYARFQTHISGRGNPLVKACVDSGIVVTLVRVWQGADHTFERKLKNRKNSQALCPCCNEWHSESSPDH